MGKYAFAMIRAFVLIALIALSVLSVLILCGLISMVPVHECGKTCRWHPQQTGM
jgi:hypothetical protein